MNKKYLACFEYFATGEGHTIEISMIIATNEEEARQKYLNTAFTSDVEAQTYFEKDISVVELDSEEGKKIISAVFKNSETLYEALKCGGREFHYKMYYNLS